MQKIEGKEFYDVWKIYRNWARVVVRGNLFLLLGNKDFLWQHYGQCPVLLSLCVHVILAIGLHNPIYLSICYILQSFQIFSVLAITRDFFWAAAT